jgi:hypothetical protein
LLALTNGEPIATLFSNLVVKQRTSLTRLDQNLSADRFFFGTATTIPAC